MRQTKWREQSGVQDGGHKRRQPTGASKVARKMGRTKCGEQIGAEKVSSKEALHIVKILWTVQGLCN